MGKKRGDKRRMDELRMEVGVKENVKKKLVRSRLKWAGHMERITNNKLQRDQLPTNCREKDARMRWEDWVKRDVERVGGEWRTTANVEGVGDC